MKTVVVPVALDERFLPIIDALTDANQVACANSFLSLLLTSALLEADARVKAEADQALRDVGPEFGADEDGDETLH